MNDGWNIDDILPDQPWITLTSVPCHPLLAARLEYMLHFYSHSHRRPPSSASLMGLRHLAGH